MSKNPAQNIFQQNSRNDSAIQQDLKQAQQELIVKEQELATLKSQLEMAKEEWEATMNCVDGLIVIADSLGQIMKCNSSTMSFFGKPDEEIIGEEWETLLSQLEVSFGNFYGNSVEIYHKRKARWFIISSYPVKFEHSKFEGVVITVHDSTEMKVVAQEIEEKNREIDENRQKLKSALEEISFLIDRVVKEQSLDIRFTNPNIRKCYEVMKCGKKECRCYGQGEQRCWQIAGTSCGGKVQGVFAEKFGNCSICVIYKNATNDPIYQIGEHFNNMMHMLEISREELEFAYAELKRTQAQMLQNEKMASIGQLAAGIAHEVNNPMGFISSNIETLAKYADRLIEYIKMQADFIESSDLKKSPEALKYERRKLKIDYITEDVKGLIKESLDGADRVKKIVSDLKSFSRVDEAGYKHADINECIESALNMISNEIRDKAAVKKEYGNIPQIKCYPQQLNQVFMNIFINALQAIDKHGEITIKTWLDKEYIRISISDTGCGIPADKIERIFEPFYTTKDVGKGAGLGLNIAYNIIKKHNGEIKVESKIGEGTTFTVKIPVVEK
jgi:signal transduction histidine kinase/PAS domain-containing protein